MSAPEFSADASTSPLPSATRLGWFDDRLNPVLVKEVRQALSGKLFRGMFLFTSAFALLFACYQMVDHGSSLEDLSGRSFFRLMYGCLSVAMHLFVPFLAFTSLGNEWEENTFDLLTLSDLRPRAIVTGKLLSAGTQAALYYSAFGPFLVFAFLLRGLDLKAVGFILGMTLLSSMTLTAIALALSSLTHAKFLRISLMAILAGGLVQATVGATVAAGAIVTFGIDFSSPELRQGIALFTTLSLLVTAISLAIACARLAHPEENRSTALRVLTLVTVAAGVVAAYRVIELVGRPEAAAGVFGAVALGTTVMCIFYSAEPERLGRRVERSVPKNPLLAILSAPLLPGGGLGFALYLCLLTLILLTGKAMLLWHPMAASTFVASASEAKSMQTAALILVGYLIVFVGFPTGLLAPWTDRPRMRIASRVAVPMFTFACIVGPAFLGLLIEHEPYQNGEHLGNPAYLLGETFRGELDSHESALLALAIAVTFAIVLNLPRIAKAVRFVLTCSRRRRA